MRRFSRRRLLGVNVAIGNPVLHSPRLLVHHGMLVVDILELHSVESPKHLVKVVAEPNHGLVETLE